MAGLSISVRFLGYFVFEANDHHPLRAVMCTWLCLLVQYCTLWSIMGLFSTPHQDSYVRDGLYANESYGNARALYVKATSANKGYNRKSFVQWAVDPTASHAKVRLYVLKADEDVSSIHWEVRNTSSDWNEGTLTWNNQPSPGSLVATVAVQDVDTWVEFDIPDDLLEAVKYTSDGLLSLVIASPFSGAFTSVASREDKNPCLRPQLTYRPDIILQCSGTCTSISESECQSLTSFSTSVCDGGLLGPSGCFYDDATGQAYYNNQWLKTTEQQYCTTERPCVCTSRVQVASNVMGILSTPHQDSYVRDGLYANESYGNARALYVKAASANKGYNRKSFVQWAVDPTASHAKVRLYVLKADEDVSSIHWEVRNTSSDWNEGTLTWNNQPSPGSLVATVAVQDVDTWVEFDIPDDLLEAVKYTSDGLLSLVIASPFSGAFTSVASREDKNPCLRPQLTYRPDIVLQCSGTCTSISESECQSLTSFGTLCDWGLPAPAGCFYNVATGQAYYNNQWWNTTEQQYCTTERPCVCTSRVQVASNVMGILSTPHQDSYVRDGLYANESYGNARALYVKAASANKGYNRKSFVQWAVDPTASHAKVRLYVLKADEDVSSIHWEVRNTSSDWNEGTLTWNNQPSPGSLVATVAVQDVDTWVEFDIPDDLLEAVKYTSDGLLSLVIASPFSGAFTSVASREDKNPCLRPQLTYRPDIVLQCSGTCTSISESECQSLTSFSTSISDGGLLAPDGCFYDYITGRTYYNKQRRTTDCAVERPCVCTSHVHVTSNSSQCGNGCHGTPTFQDTSNLTLALCARRCYTERELTIMVYYGTGLCECWSSCSYTRPASFHDWQMRDYVVYQFGAYADLQSGPCGPTAAERNMPYWMAADGCPWVGTKHRTQILERSNQLAVRCCSFDGTACVSRYDDGQCLPSEATHAEATMVCAGLGMRLCHIAELESGLCCKTGCNNDTRLAWSSDTGYSSDWILRAVTANGDTGCSDPPALSAPLGLSIEDCMGFCEHHPFLEHSSNTSCQCFTSCDLSRDPGSYASPANVLENLRSAWHAASISSHCGNSCHGTPTFQVPSTVTLAICAATCYMENQSAIMVYYGNGLCECWSSCSYTRPASFHDWQMRDYVVYQFGAYADLQSGPCGPTAAERNMPYWMAADGCPWVGTKHQTQILERSNQLAVRCCSFDGTACVSRYDDGQCLPSEATHAEATMVCAGLGMRLCHTAAELQLCCFTGCAYDDRLVWSSDTGYSSDWILRAVTANGDTGCSDPPAPFGLTVGALGVTIEECMGFCEHYPFLEHSFNGSCHCRLSCDLTRNASSDAGPANVFENGRSVWHVTSISSQCGNGCQGTPTFQNTSTILICADRCRKTSAFMVYYGNGLCECWSSCSYTRPASFHDWQMRDYVVYQFGAYADLQSGPCGPTAAERNMPYWMAADGCRWVGTKHQTQILERSNQLAVRCCSFDGTACVSRYGNRECLPSEATHAEATMVCAGLGMRLCHIAELESGLCCKTGCKHDTRLAWSSDTGYSSDWILRAVTANGDTGCSDPPALSAPLGLSIEDCMGFCEHHPFLEHSSNTSCQCFTSCDLSRDPGSYASPANVFASGDTRWLLSANISKGEGGCSGVAEKFAWASEGKSLPDCQDFCSDYGFVQYHTSMFCYCFRSCDYALSASDFLSPALVYQSSEATQTDDHCQDIPNWVDSDGDGCETYAQRAWCFSPWILHYASASGLSAAVACCACGGGIQLNDASRAAADGDDGWAQGPQGHVAACEPIGATCPSVESLATCKRLCLSGPAPACNAVNYHAAHETCCPQRCPDPNAPRFRISTTGPDWEVWAHPGNGWNTAVQLSADAAAVLVEVPAAAFRAAFARCPVVRYLRNGAVHALYRRTSPVPDGFDAFRVFTRTWASADNTLHADFELFSSDDDMWANAAPWQYCNYDVEGVGFPNSCGPAKPIQGAWFAMPGAPRRMEGITNGAVLQYYSGSPCPLEVTSGWVVERDVGPEPHACPSDTRTADLAAAKAACERDLRCFAVVAPASPYDVLGLALAPELFYGMLSSPGCAICPQSLADFAGWEWHSRRGRHIAPERANFSETRVISIGADGECSVHTQGWTTESDGGPRFGACRLPDVDAPTLAAAQALCERNPHCFAVVEPGSPAVLDSGVYLDGRFYGLSSVAGCGLCSDHAARFFGWKCHHRGPRHVEPLPDRHGRHNVIDVAVDGACSSVARAVFAPLVTTGTGTCGASGYSAITTPEACFRAALALGLADTFVRPTGPDANVRSAPEQCRLVPPRGVGFGPGPPCDATSPCVCAGQYLIRLTRPRSAGAGGLHHLHLREMEVYSDTGMRRPLRLRGASGDPAAAAGPGPNRTVDGDYGTAYHSRGGAAQELWVEWALDDGGPVPALLRIWADPPHSARLLGCVVTIVADYPQQQRLVETYTVRDDLPVHTLRVTGGVEVAYAPPAQPHRVYTAFDAAPLYADQSRVFASLGSFVAAAGYTFVSPPSTAAQVPADAAQLRFTSPSACTVYLVYPLLGRGDMEAAHRLHRPWIADEGWAADRTLTGPSTNVSTSFTAGDDFQPSETWVKHFQAGTVTLMGHNAPAGAPLIFVKPRLAAVHRTHNVAARSAGGVPFASSSAAASCPEPGPMSGAGPDPAPAAGHHCWTALNDGVPGDAHGWRPGAPRAFAGVALADAVPVRYVTLGRDATGRAPKGRWEGVRYTLQYTAQALPPPGGPAGAGNGTGLDGLQWTTYPVTDDGAFSLTSAHTHVYELSPAVTMTAVRLLVSSGTAAVDEIGVHMAEEGPAPAYDSATDSCVRDPRPAVRAPGLSFHADVRLVRGRTRYDPADADVRMCLRSAAAVPAAAGDWAAEFAVSASAALLEFRVEGGAPATQRFDYAFRFGVRYRVRVAYDPQAKAAVLFVDDLEIQRLEYATAVAPLIGDGEVGCMNGTHVLHGVISDLTIGQSATFYWLEAGCPESAGDPPRGYFADPDLQIGAVQCCGTAGSALAEGRCTRDRCASDAANYTYHEAVRACAAQGWRLCSKAEALSPGAAGCCGAGCELDAALVWTSTPLVGCPGSETVVEITTKRFARQIAWDLTGARYRLVSREYKDDQAYAVEFCLYGGDYVLATRAAGGGGWHGATLSLSRNGVRLLGPVGAGAALAFSVSDESWCGGGAVDVTNAALGLAPTVTSYCAQTPGVLTDGDYPCHDHDEGHWKACFSVTRPDDWIALPFPNGGSRCVRLITVWPACALSSAAADDVAGELAGTYAEVLGPGGWQRCGAAIPGGVPRARPYTFRCAMFGTAVRVYQPRSYGRLALSEIEVFPERTSCEANVDVPGCRPVVINTVTGAEGAGAVGWDVGGACPGVGVPVGQLLPSAFYSTVVCLAAGDHQLLVRGSDPQLNQSSNGTAPTGGAAGAGTVTVALLDGSAVPAAPVLSTRRPRATAAFRVPEAAAPCAGPTVDVAGCLPVAVRLFVPTGCVPGGAAAPPTPLRTSAALAGLVTGLGNLSIAGSCPLFSRTVTDGALDATVCLAPGDYAFVAVDAQGDGWGCTTFSVALQGPLTVPLIHTTDVGGFGLRAPFRVPAAFPALRPETEWLHRAGDRSYITLPALDNWSEAYPLTTTWQRLRISGAVARGQTAVYVDLTDTTYTTSNGRTSDFYALTAVKWGFAADCRGGTLQSRYRLSLAGTPFWVEDTEPAMPIAGREATGGAHCYRDQRVCAAACGGRCGECGFGSDHDVQVLKLLVVDQAMFDAAFAVDCGPPAYPTYHFPPECDTTSTGACQPRCVEPYAGAPYARCTASGLWVYGEPCTHIATCFAMGWNSLGQLGTRDTRDAARPQPLHAPDNRKIRRVAVGGWHSAALTDGAAYVMGSNRYGQLGLGLETGDAGHSTPLPLAAPNGRAITAVALGNSHTVFVAGGEAYATGDNRFGQLGLPADVPMAGAPQPLRPPTGAAVAAVFAGAFHTALLTEAGPLFQGRDWAADADGLVPATRPAPAPAPGGSWTLVFRQTIGAEFEATTKEAWRRTGTPADGDYSVLDRLEEFRGPDGKFLFKLAWPNMTGDAPNFNVWKQASNPLQTPGGGVAGYEAVEVHHRSNAWGGLEHSGARPGALLDGSAGPGAAFYAVGATLLLDGGVPGPAGPESAVELFVRVGGAPAAVFSPGLRGTCPEGYWEVDAGGRRAVESGCCAACPGGAAQCYSDCACKCSSATDCAGLVQSEGGGGAAAPGHCLASHGCEGGSPCYPISDWRCLADTIMVRLNAAGDVQCMSEDGALCYNPIGGCAAAKQRPAARHVTCGVPRAVWGGRTGYEDREPRHWCYVARAWLTGPQAYVVGLNSHGALGLGDKETRHAPALLRSPNGHAIAAVALGRRHSAIIAGGLCYVFGSNKHGQLGLNTHELVYLTPQLLELPSRIDAQRVHGATRVARQPPVTQVQVGHEHTALISDGELYVMGSNARGQLGLGRVPLTRAAVRLPAPNAAVVSAVAAGAYSTVFVAGRDCYVMGANTNGQLGLGLFEDVLYPAVLRAPNGLAVDSMAVGWFHTAFTADVTVTPTATATVTPTSAATATSSGTATPIVSRSPTPSHSGTPTTAASHSPTTSCSATPSSTASSSITSSVTGTPTATPSTTATPSHSVTPSASLSSTASTTTSPTATTSISPTATQTRTTTASFTTTPSHSVTPSITPSSTVTSTTSPTATASISSVVTCTGTTTASFTTTPSHSVTPSITPSSTVTSTTSPTATASISSVVTHTGTTTASFTTTPSHSVTPSITPSSTVTSTTSPTATASISSVVTCTGTTTASFTTTPSHSVTPSITPSSTVTSTTSPTATASISSVVTCTGTTTASFTTTPSHSVTPSITPSSTVTSTTSPTATASISSVVTCTGTTTASFTTTPSHSVTPSITPSSTVTSTTSPTATASISSVVTCTGTTTASFTTTPSHSVTPSITPSSTVTSTTSPTATASISSVVTCTGTTTASFTTTPSHSVTPSITPSSTVTSTTSPTATASISSVVTCTGTTTASFTTTPSHSVTPSITPSSTVTSTTSPTATASISSVVTHTGTTTASFTTTPSHSVTPSITPSSTVTSTTSPTATASISSVVTCTGTTTASFTTTPSHSVTPSITPSSTVTSTTSPTATASISSVVTCTGTTTASFTTTPSHSVTPSITPSSTVTSTTSPTATASISSVVTHTGTTTASFTTTPSHSVTPSITPSSTVTSTTSPTATASISCTHGCSPSVSLTASPLFTTTPSPSVTPTTTLSSTVKPSHSSTPSITPSSLSTPTTSVTSSTIPSKTLTLTVCSTSSTTLSITATSTSPITASPTVSGTMSDTATLSHIFTPTYSPSATQTSSRLYTRTSTHTDLLTLTPTTTPSCTGTASRLFTMTPTPSCTATASRLFTMTPTPSCTATASRLFTMTPTPSCTGTASRLFTMTPTPSCTATASRLFTPSSTPSSTSTPSHLFTPTATVSETTTSSVPFTPSGTASCTPTQTQSCTPTPSPISTSTATPSQTASPTSSSTPTQASSRTSTPTSSATRTGAPSHTPTRTVTSTLTTASSITTSSTVSDTILPTTTPSPTGTAVLDHCSTEADGGAATGRLQVQDVNKCLHSTSLGTGSSMGLSRKVMVRILKLDGNLTVRLASGCPSQGAACDAGFTPRDVGRDHPLRVGAAPIEVLLLYRPPPAAARRRSAAAGDGFAVELFVVHAASTLVVLLVALGAVLAVPCCAFWALRRAKRRAAEPVPYALWARHGPWAWLRRLRWGNPWKPVAMGCGLCLALAGTVWYVVLDLMAHAADTSFAPAVLGLAVAGLGLLLCALAALWALRDDAAHECPVCQRPASPWRFSGTYVPVFGRRLGGAAVAEARERRAPDAAARPTDVRKGHTACLRCVRCRAPVVLDPWPSAPVHRPYHRLCWEELCRQLCAHPGGVHEWDSTPGLTDLERAHVLAASIRCGSADCLAALLALHPDLDVYALPDAPSARHCAAGAGRLPALQRLLTRRRELDACDVAEVAAHSLLVTGLGAGLDDLYVQQAPLTYNAEDVFIGHRYAGTH